MKFRTEVETVKFAWQTGYLHKSMFMGSCFTENIGEKMNDLKFPSDINSFGILYNPASIANGLRFLIQNKKFDETELIYNNGLWHSFFHHSRFSSPEKEEALAKINDRITLSSQFLKNASFLFITFGTAWVYEYLQSGKIVSNCHKIPDREFRRFRLKPDEITEEYKILLNELWSYNPDLRIVFTVSPIRHRKDGMVENQLSKATLLLAANSIIDEFGEDKCNYFPAYEIVMDELRDYRFYDEDMIHLSKPAVNHIWDKFQPALIDSESIKVSEKIKNIVNAVNHKPFNKFTNEHLAFLKLSLKKTINLEKEFNYLNLQSEKSYFQNEIKSIKQD